MKFAWCELGGGAAIMVNYRFLQESPPLQEWRCIGCA